MLKAIIIFLIPTIFAFLGIMAVNGSTQPEVVHIPAAYGQGTGYQQEPEQYTVTASSNYRWHHGTGNTWKIVVGIFLFAAGGAFVYQADPDVKKGFIVLGVLWLMGFAFIFGKHVVKYYGPAVYEKTISAEQYEQNKDHLDSIFNDDI